MLPKLRYPADIRSLIFVAIAYFLLYFPLLHPLPNYLTLIWITASSFFCFIIGVINHNHKHLPIFESSQINHLFNIILTLSLGRSATEIVVAHNYNHHLYRGDIDDWIKPQLAGSGPGIIRLPRYVVQSLINIAQRKRSLEAQTLPDDEQQSLNREKLTLRLLILLLIIISPKKTLIFILIPWAIGIVSLLGINLLQHENCQPESRYQNSRNFTSPLGNWLFFNNGYHTIHHLRPTLHWSLLKTAHEKIVKPRINLELEVKSILKYLLFNYLFQNSPFADSKTLTPPDNLVPEITPKSDK
jgi:fatty acid desaturase